MEKPKISAQFINPLWIISMFFSFTEIILGYAVFKTEGGIQIALTVFVIGFPLLITIAFFAMLWSKPGHLYAPKDFQNDKSFIQTLSDARKSQEMSGAVYLNTEDVKTMQNIYSSVQVLVQAMGFDKAKDGPAQRGSFFQKMKLFLKDEESKKEIKEVLNQAAESIKLASVRNQELRSDNVLANNKLAEAAASLITSLSDVNEAVLRIGSIILVKVVINDSPVMLVETVSQELGDLLNKNPDLLKSPITIFNIINSIKKAGSKEGKETEAVWQPES